ncbi:hypothetical protein AAFN86_15525 [Roseomonas sp. CAU 1739]|uniref:Dyp-type peroxidase n=1 Tax=Roseomonas sp. CAU 1739 TaxID=3140364 RepID=UPI00325AB3B9
MATLQTILGQPIRWQAAPGDADLALFLGDLQANILKGHGRHHTGNLFLSFAGMTPDDVAAVLRTLGQNCTSAYSQLRKNRRQPPYLDGGTVMCVFLSAGGYRALGPLATLPPGEAFAADMPARQAILSDPPRSAWQAAGWTEGLPAPDAMVLVADAREQQVTAALEAVEGWLNGTGVRVLVVERGRQQTRVFKHGAAAEGVEHFGYVDGRSQPLFLEEDLAKEPQAQWSARFNPSQFIVADPNGRTPLSAGSYFVFRKLEQNVRGFKKAEEDLAAALGLVGEDAERAGATIVGRFEDGTPIVLSEDATQDPPPNDFTFDADTNGAKCPFHAHIRKTNPRGDVKRQFGLPDASGDRNPIMARRGITYGHRRRKADDTDFADPEGQEPTGDVGLLFMAYMASIEAQFEFTQQSWANNEDFVRPGTGVDPVIGQGAGAKPLGFGGFVKMLGGAYFFAPSLSFLRSVGT